MLRELYANIAVTTSPTTASRAVDALAACGAYAGTPRGDTRGPLYRRALRCALTGGAGRVHYLDFDRALHWILQSPRELAAVLRRARAHRTLLVGRTPRAHRSHQRPLWITETGMNAHFGARLGFAGRVDFLVPSFVADQDATREILARSRARNGAIYGELAALLAGAAPRLAYVECDGLDWETPDRHRRAVRRVGLARWRDRLDTPLEWRLRTALAAEIVRGFEDAAARYPASGVRLTRIAAPRSR